jgi:hypothetical protein
LVEDSRAREVALGTTLAALFQHLGRATISYRSGRPPHRRCVVYPIEDTQVWDEFGSPEAAEWEFCVDRRARVAEKHRLSATRARG